MYGFALECSHRVPGSSRYCIAHPPRITMAQVQIDMLSLTSLATAFSSTPYLHANVNRYWH
jgi:hypothetical protein